MKQKFFFFLHKILSVFNRKVFFFFSFFNYYDNRFQSSLGATLSGTT